MREARKLYKTLEYLFSSSDQKYEKEKYRSSGGVGFYTRQQNCVLKMRYGLAENEEMSLQQISKVLDYTKEGIRKIEQRGLKNLREALGEAA